MNPEFTIGQRWISQSEPQLGLGIIIDVAGRLITISFPAVAERRIYATDQSPLNRVEYQVGDAITTNDEQQLKVIDKHINQGLIIYNCSDESGQQQIIQEIEISSFVTFTSPRQRLFNYQIDSSDAFKLRVSTLYFLDRLQRSCANGLIGSRTSLLPHQIYITHEVSKRFAPRVLLADEVGLGKTIEAGMIIHQQLHAGLIARVLIVVPPSLIHQWLVEMIRRFNLRFSIIDQDSIQSDQNLTDLETQLSSDDAQNFNSENGHTTISTNPFESEQLIICSIDLLTSKTHCIDQIRSAGFDLLIVDEAHHLSWTLESSSPEYNCVAALSTICPGVLLLTATPESINTESFFAQLSLLDASRFHDFNLFVNEQASFRQLGKIVESLVQLKAQLSQSCKEIQLETSLLTQLEQLLPGGSVSQNSVSEQLLDQWIDHIIDIHGTSRVLFRNTRSAIGGFKQRKLCVQALEFPQQYRSLGPGEMICPELLMTATTWLEFDPRVKWLIDFLAQIRPAKVLLICTHAQTAIQLEHYLQLTKGINSAAFHENLSILERDRAAAYFADEDRGAQILICSEIGSEGRNFQFSKHLVLFDLPVNPDFLEQRIGRLDRIGQSNTISIHVPYIQGSAQEVLFLWYEQGLNQFVQTFSSAKQLFDDHGGKLFELINDWPENHSEVTKFIGEIKIKAQLLRKESELGKDKLLEYNSCRMDASLQIINEITKFEQDVSFDDYMECIFDAFNIEYYEQSENIKIIEPIENISNDIFIKLKTERLSITSDRETALVREDVEFFSFEHPMIEDVMESIITGEYGNINISTLSLKNIKSGSIFLEAYFASECLSPKYLQLQRFLPLSPLRYVFDEKCRNIEHLLNHEVLNKHSKNLDKKMLKPVIAHIGPKVENMLLQLNKLTQQEIKNLKQAAIIEQKHALTVEIERLESLQKVNSLVRKEEIDFFKEQIEAGEEHIQRATYKLQAIRVILNI